MTDDFFRARIDQMIDLRHPLAMLAQRLPWDRLERALAPCFARNKTWDGGDGATALGPDLLGSVPVPARSPSNAGCPCA